MSFVQRGVFLCLAGCLSAVLFTWLLSEPARIAESDLCPVDYHGQPESILDREPQPDSPSAPASIEEPEDPVVDYDSWEFQFGKYTILSKHVVTNGDSYSSLEVWNGQTLVYQTDGFQFLPASEYATDGGVSDYFFTPGTDVTGNGIPDMVVVDHSGEGHCCLTYYIFELGEEFRVVDEIRAEHGHIQFVLFDGEPNPVIKMQDRSYAYLLRWFSESPAPDLFLRYTNGHYTMATDLMRIPTPTVESLQSSATEITAAYEALNESGELTRDWPVDTGLWSAMLALVYSSHEEDAQRLFDMAWPAVEENKERALEIFVEAVAQSYYWKSVHPDPESELAGDSNQEKMYPY